MFYELGLELAAYQERDAAFPGRPDAHDQTHPPPHRSSNESHHLMSEKEILKEAYLRAIVDEHRARNAEDHTAGNRFSAVAVALMAAYPTDILPCLDDLRFSTQNTIRQDVPVRLSSINPNFNTLNYVYATTTHQQKSSYLPPDNHHDWIELDWDRDDNVDTVLWRRPRD
jgi:hypothetical protein